MILLNLLRPHRLIYRTEKLGGDNALKTACAVVLFLNTVCASAAYPDKPIRIIVPYVPGGNSDITARTLAPCLSAALGQTIVVENRGGGGTNGTEIAARAPAAGYTLLLGSSATLTNAPALYPKLGYDPLKDFATTSMTTQVPIVIETPPSVDVRTVREFIALVESTPEEFATFIRDDLAKWNKLVQETGIKLE